MKMQTLGLTAVLLGLWNLGAEAARPCRIEVVEKGTGWPVPMVELRTTHQVRWMTDNAGVIAFDLPEQMGRLTWFEVVGHGYVAPVDGLGQRGVRVTPVAGKTIRIELERTIVARRLGRMTGAGLFAESQKLGRERRWRETGVHGCDSVLTAVYRGKLYWAWGDTTVGHYPLGLLHASSATSARQPLDRFEPPLRLNLDYFTDDKGQPRVVAPMPGSGPTWLTGYACLADQTGRERLVSAYMKITPPIVTRELGLCVWNEVTATFERHRVLWEKKEGGAAEPTLLPQGHPVLWRDAGGRDWMLYGNPFPRMRHPATFEAWENPDTWEPVAAPESLVAAGTGDPIKPHSGSVAWNPWRKRWVVVFMQAFGQPNTWGEIWYAEAEAPTGPWGPAVKVLSHDHYTFYNPRIHPEFTPAGSPVLLFEGTFTTFLAAQPQPAPRHDYNQVLYRLDLDDPALGPAQGRPEAGPGGGGCPAGPRQP